MVGVISRVDWGFGVTLGHYGLRFNLCGAGGDLQAAFLMTGCLAAGVLVRPLGRPVICPELSGQRICG
jgi:hypothetical protein